MSAYQKYKTKQGFTLIETFVAITILMIAILGPMSMISKFYADSAYAKNQIAASFLAQDGIETIQNIISHNSEVRKNQLIYDEIECDSLSTDWLSGLGDCKNGCNVSSSLGSVSPCSKAQGCNLKTVDGFYVHSDTPVDSSIFTRKIVIIAGDEESGGGSNNKKRSAQITSYVWWSQKGNTKGPVVVSGMAFKNQCPGL